MMSGTTIRRNVVPAFAPCTADASSRSGLSCASTLLVERIASGIPSVMKPARTPQNVPYIPGTLMYVHKRATPRTRPGIAHGMSSTASIAMRPKRILRINAKLTRQPITTHTVLAQNISATVLTSARCVVASVRMNW